MSLTASGATEVDPLIVMTGLAAASATGRAEATAGTKAAVTAAVSAHAIAMRLRMSGELLSMDEAPAAIPAGSGGSLDPRAGSRVKKWRTPRGVAPRGHDDRPACPRSRAPARHAQARSRRTSAT